MSEDFQADAGGPEGPVARPLPRLARVAKWAVLATAAATILDLAGALATVSDGPPPQLETFVVSVDPFYFVAWIILGTWMARAHDHAAAAGRRLDHRRASAWIAWVVPLWNFVGPYRYMREIAQSTEEAVLKRWWAWWVVSLLTSVAGTLATNDEYALGEFAGPLRIGSAVATAVSWWWLRRIIVANTPEYVPSIKPPAAEK